MSPRHVPVPAPREDAVRRTALESLRVIVAALSRSARSIERRTGVTNAQLFLLQQLADTDSLSVNDLAERARTQQSTVSTVVSRLAAAGLVRKRRSAHDARRATLSLTPAARRLLRNSPPAPTAQLIAALGALGTRDAEMLAKGLRALVRTLDVAALDPPLLFEDGRHTALPRLPTRSRTASMRQTQTYAVATK